LRNGMLLLLLDVVALVMLSRYITSPSRSERLRRATQARTADLDEIHSVEQVTALLDEHGAPRETTGLAFTEVGIAVHQAGSPTPANLAWKDCAAVVHSQLALANGTTLSYLQFVALHEERIRRGTGDRRARALARSLGLTESAAAMVWVVAPQLVRLPPLVLQYVEKHHPHVRVVRPDVVDHVE
jgi:hypothetical protein